MRKEIKELQSEVEEWKEEYRFERRQMIKAVKELREWKGMNNLIVQLKGTVGELQSLLRKGATAGREIRQDMEDVSEDASEMVTLSGGLRLKKALLSRINSSSYQRYTAELLAIVFGRDMLASHSLNGRKASNKGDNVVKDILPAETVGQLIGRAVLPKSRAAPLARPRSSPSLTGRDNGGFSARRKAEHSHDQLSLIGADSADVDLRCYSGYLCSRSS
ncbi:hypothetical protein SKAU_G00159950 [Synaphobranchus kaupii]|uniref:Uncharacterized protein n=1 Tax=Synaphobranchus kaupii TaxID=118154 RepID=A0A9Q1FIB2_SYNKA|nr:hypothetical protein SKAU_G00159950 [Synaphobranchus kaupii]